MHSIVTAIEAVRGGLQERLDGVTLRFKADDDPKTYHETKPHVFAFTYDDISPRSGLPTKDMPCVLVQVLSASGEDVECAAHICVVDPAVQEAELVDCLDGEVSVSDRGIRRGYYVHREGEAYWAKHPSIGDHVRRQLYRACLMLGETVKNALENFDGVAIRDVSLAAPSPFMREMPYCECAVTFTVKLATAKATRTAVHESVSALL